MVVHYRHLFSGIILSCFALLSASCSTNTEYSCGAAGVVLGDAERSELVQVLGGAEMQLIVTLAVPVGENLSTATHIMQVQDTFLQAMKGRDVELIQRFRQTTTVECEGYPGGIWCGT